MIVERKLNHFRICLEEGVEVGSAGFENYSFTHNALPEIDFDKIDTSVKFLRKELKAPILISPMTGGTKQATLINRNLAKAAQKVGVAMAVGSQRVAIEKPSLAKTFQVRKFAPDILLFANLGAVQLNYGFGVKECRQAVEMIEADGLILHLNPLQEVIQPEGNTDFSGLLEKIKKIARQLKVPLIVKEVGVGISGKVAQKLFQAGVEIIDVAGWGGTNWALIEGIRAGNEEIGELFAHWGIPTAEAISQCAEIKGLIVIGSGGIRNGIEIAKALALGANLVGIALPFLKPATHSVKAVEKKLQSLISQLKTVMFCLGVKNIDELKKVKLISKV
ncbi:type 2 isopentenyl-diphosphate Delta-isomerase [Candidatus Shapirobacteria bacterium CG10_big_fil_rev_8_21_14_0_10_38_14]|uniref:Isopentenyl-diphosphate delta-isomerase n=1 Tax=Candidatus Shapirobacteria bacterium CG10_big_fil_rev_8_21_14_0_10_38_14 TaxID=1974483 RepID=A0A2M8L5D3_9BACT|nr:MAG: type 2 isopentenyl-diphosphate Delta-isomerase [Candidatus Shapirobacteria bacterium CG10_big_fil_rev_8_21_14_0_10_38_14]